MTSEGILGLVFWKVNRVFYQCKFKVVWMCCYEILRRQEQRSCNTRLLPSVSQLSNY